MKFPEDSPGIDELLNQEAHKDDQEEIGSPDKEAAKNELSIDSPAKRPKAIKIEDEKEESPLYSEQPFSLEQTNSNASAPGKTRKNKEKPRPTGKFGGASQQDLDDFLKLMDNESRLTPSQSRLGLEYKAEGNNFRSNISRNGALQARGTKPTSKTKKTDKSNFDSRHTARSKSRPLSNRSGLSAHKSNYASRSVPRKVEDGHVCERELKKQRDFETSQEKLKSSQKAKSRPISAVSRNNKVETKSDFQKSNGDKSRGKSAHEHQSIYKSAEKLPKKDENNLSK